MSLIYGRCTYLGRTAFAENSLPITGKNEYGLDTLRRTFIGAAPFLDTFIKGLSQGIRYDQPGRAWFLQTWEVDDNKLWPTVFLNYKGLASGKLPKPRSDDEWITQNATVTAQFDPPIDIDGVEVADATKNINYRCLQTAWQYVTDKRPLGAKIGKTSWAAQPFILNSVIEAGGIVYNGNNAPAPIATALSVTPSYVVLGPIAREVFGTPYWEVDEVVANMFLVQ